MRPRQLLVLALLGPLAASPPALAQAPPEPPALKLPVGARVRVRLATPPGAWVRGTLVGADSESVGLLPEGAPPLIGSELRLPRETLANLEIATGTKRHWLRGLLIGAAAGLVTGLVLDVDPVRCEFDYDYFCSRSEAVAAGGLGGGAIGASIGALVKTDVWTPVALDALAPPAPRASRAGLSLRVVPGGVSLAISLGF